MELTRELQAGLMFLIARFPKQFLLPSSCDFIYGKTCSVQIEVTRGIPVCISYFVSVSRQGFVCVEENAVARRSTVFPFMHFPK